MKNKFAVMMILCCSAVCAEPVIWMMGDSTMANYPEKRFPLTGWGQVLEEFCRTGVKVNNHARSGWSTTKFMRVNPKSGKSQFAAFADKIKTGDYLIIQFGHNDQKKKSVNQYASPEQYKEYMLHFANEAKKRGATPVFVTSICRRLFRKDKSTGKLVAYSDLSVYPDITRTLAKENKIDLVDLNQFTQAKYTELGEEKSKEMFNYVKSGDSLYWDAIIEKQRAKSKTPGLHVDNTHLCRKGATVVARGFVELAKQQKLSISACFK